MGISSSVAEKICFEISLPFSQRVPKDNIVWKTCLLQDDDLNLFLFMDEQHQMYLCDYLMEKIIFVEHISHNSLYIGAYHRLWKKNTSHIIYRTQSGKILYEYPVMDLVSYIQRGDVILSITNHLFSNPTISFDVDCTEIPFANAIQTFLQRTQKEDVSNPL